ncbi:MAG: hypothetical protein M3Z05_11335 [Gemmatimonadota bacterium]|nr:hypothetical protein [Gemmatimonadota bacterium]
MRFLRALTAATGFLLVLSQQSSAQGTRQFKDAWFWGLKTGITSYSSATTSNGGAPLIGAEWLITRTNGGLYLSMDQAFIKSTGSFVDRDADSAYVRYPGINNLRKFTMAGMIFPAQTRNLHPYFGAGLVLNQVGGVALIGAPTPISNDSISAKKTAFSPTFMAGVQARFKPASLFVQGTASPAQHTFFYSNISTNQLAFSLEFGVRYNVGTSIDRAK